MTSQLEIYKMALAEIGTRSTISAVNDGSTEANYCNIYYNSVRDHALRAARWNFAHHTDTLSLWKSAPGTPENPSTTLVGWQRTYPATPWLYSYLIDQIGFVYARSIVAQVDIATISPPIFSVGGSMLSIPRVLRVPFEVAIDPYDQAGVLLAPSLGKKVVLTNAQSPLFEFTSSYNDETFWDSSFVMVIMLAMAARLAVGLTGDKQIAQMKLQEANSIIMQARASDGNEGITVLDSVPDWLRVRGVGGSNVSFSDFYYPYGPLFSIMV